MKIKLTVWGVCLITIISLTGCASFYEASISIARQYAEAVNSGKIEGGEYSSHVDAWANGGIGGQLLVGADAVVGMYEKISDNDYSGARELIKGSINNYVADPNMSSRGAKGSIISAGLGLGSSIIDDYSRNKIANNNEAFMEDHSKYMDPESPLYDPYFMDRLEYDDQGQIVGFLDFGDFIKKIREQEAMMDETNWDNVFNEIVDTYYVNPSEREQFIKDHYDELSDKTYERIGEIRKQRMEDYFAGKDFDKVQNYNMGRDTNSKSPHDLNGNQNTVTSIGNSTGEKIEDFKATSLQISGYAFDVVTLTTSQKEELDEVAEILKANLSTSVRIVGHVCDIGTDKVNNAKGLRRAQLAKDYLVGEGVSSDRITVETKGETCPLVPNNSPANRQKNRRIEVVFN